jgi:hypothetical protein
LSGIIESTIKDLESAVCIQIEQDFFVASTVYGKIASYYYLTYRTVGLLMRRLTHDYNPVGDPELRERPDGDFSNLLRILADVPEYEELPVRHNEDKMNQDLERYLPVRVWSVSSMYGGDLINTDYDNPHVKTFLLLQGHLSRTKNLPCSDYATDTTSVLDQAIRVMQAMIDVAANQTFLTTALAVMQMMQCIKQARWPLDSTLLTLPRITEEVLSSIKHRSKPVENLKDLRGLSESDVTAVFRNVSGLSGHHVQDITRVVLNLPWLNIKFELKGAQERHGRWEIQAGKQYELRVQLKRTHSYRGDHEFRIYSPRFPKPQTEGWFVVLGVKSKDELVALKRAAPGGTESKKAKTSVQRGTYLLNANLVFTAPEKSGDVDYTVHVISDGYMGIDQVVDLKIRVWNKGDEQLI